ncbi:MAG: molybdate ABC transporter substrate-binding protein [Xanthobacteraceae bacterium]
MFLVRPLRGVVATILVGAIVLAFVAAPAVAQTRDILVFGAASLKDALDDIDAQYLRQSGKKVVTSYAASSALAKQIEAGAPADVFISADLDWMDYLAERKLIKPETRKNLVGNALVLIAPANSTIRLTIAPNFPLAQTLGNERLAMADPRAVPAGKYGQAALEKLGVWSSVAGKVAAAENVRATLLLVARGEAPLGIVYATDAFADKGVKIIGEFPPDTHPPIIYPVAAVAGSSNPAVAPYLDYLQGPAAKAAFERQGFKVLSPPR